MKVLCENIINPVTGKQETLSPWLTIGREYEVLEIVAVPGREVKFRLIGDDESNTPGVWDSRLFRTTSTRLPSAWVASVHDGGTVTFGPEAWQSPGFWESFFNGDTGAQRTYETVLRAIEAELSELPASED